ncbi:UNKNOWN [Stylonychia lemnae]|uniref:Uncharacterized protein n=1 Tax=Stylonychia lemnae TaxID=5949 RepID=A0A078B3L3_STYLE|nr:UNKNOWN [Stylonychia lemnae]|eukprot:CDW88841.1 UNKNOWN [Stylonychia lemnae]
MKSCLLNCIKQQDMYGRPITLTYQKSQTFKSVIGGIFTLITRLSILVFFLLELANVLRKQSTIKNSNYIRDLANDLTEYQFDQSNFDIAVSLSYMNDWTQSITPVIYRYALVSISQMSFGFVVQDGQLVWELKEDDFPLIKCPPGRFLGEEKITKTLGIETSFLCPDKLNLTLQGSFSSKQAKFLRINVRKCEESRLKLLYPNETCASQSEIDRVFEKMQLWVPIINQYFDDYELNAYPIKTTIYNAYFTTAPNLSQHYFVKLSENRAIVRDSYLSSNVHEQILTYYSIRQEYQFNKIPDDNFSPIQITIAIDENIKQTDKNLDRRKKKDMNIQIIKMEQQVLQDKNQGINQLDLKIKKLLQTQLNNDLSFSITLMIFSSTGYKDYAIRVSKLLAQLYLTKQQRFLMPYFNDKLIYLADPNQINQKECRFEEKIKDWQQINEDHKSNIQKYLGQLIKSSEKSQIDRKILKNLIDVEKITLNSSNNENFQDLKFMNKETDALKEIIELIGSQTQSDQDKNLIKIESMKKSDIKKSKTKEPMKKKKRIKRNGELKNKDLGSTDDSRVLKLLKSPQSQRIMIKTRKIHSEQVLESFYD